MYVYRYNVALVDITILNKFFKKRFFTVKSRANDDFEYRWEVYFIEHNWFPVRIVLST